MPELWFKFDNARELSEYLREIEPYLPFAKLDMKAFRLVGPDKNGVQNVVRKLKFQEI